MFNLDTENKFSVIIIIGLQIKYHLLPPACTHIQLASKHFQILQGLQLFSMRTQAATSAWEYNANRKELYSSCTFSLGISCYWKATGPSKADCEATQWKSALRGRHDPWVPWMLVNNMSCLQDIDLWSHCQDLANIVMDVRGCAAAGREE